MRRFAPAWMSCPSAAGGRDRSGTGAGPGAVRHRRRPPTQPADSRAGQTGAGTASARAAGRADRACDAGRPPAWSRPPGEAAGGRQPRAPLPLPPPAVDRDARGDDARRRRCPAPAKPAEEEKPVGTGLPLPRFAALRSDDVNLRAGPGFRYPIEWVYKRRDLPMEIEREFEVWRLVQDPDGIRGWVHQATLTGRRTFMVQGADATLRAEPKDDAAPVAILKVGVIGRIRSCEAGSDWCRLQVGDYRGYLKRSQFWGVLPDEVIAP